MPENKDSASDGKASSRREFISKSARILYIAPLVVSYNIAEIHDEKKGYALPQGPTPYPHHGEK